jgi:type IV pilus assembly protein PilO
VAITLESIVKLSKPMKIFILIVLMGAILGIYFYSFYLPQHETLQKKKAEMEVLERQVRELRIVAANMKRFKEEVAKLREELKLAVSQLPTSKEIPSLLANISNLGTESGLEFLLFRPMPEINRDFYAEIPVEIKVKGNYHQVARFFDKVGKLPRIVNINAVSMDNAKETAGRWEIQTSCTATTFKFIEREPIDLAKEKKPAGEKGAPPRKR